MAGIVEAILSLASIKAILLGAVVFLVVYWLIQKRKYRLPPGPFALPLIGNYKGPSPWIILNNTDVTLEALVRRGTDFADRPQLVTTDLMSKGGKDIGGGRYGPTWKLHRKIFVKAMRHYLSGKNLETALGEACSKVIDVICTEKGPFDPSKYCDYVVFNLLCSACFGMSYNLDDEELVRIMKLLSDFNEAFGAGLVEDIIPYFKDIWPSKRYTKLENTVDEMLDILRTKYKAHEETFNKDNIRDYTDSLILARREAENEGDTQLLAQLTETHLLMTLFNIFLGGVDTSRMTLNWAILHMAGHQDIQAKVQEELDNVLGRNRFPGIEDRENLGFTEAVLHESMRLNLATPMTLPHRTLCDTQVGGYDIPEGSVVLVNLWALHHDPKYWKDVDKFDPYRYLDSDGKRTAKPESWLPFSAGRRACLGEPMAKSQLYLLFATLLQKFKIKLPSGVTTKFEENEETFGTTPAKYEIVVEQRY